MSSSIVTEAIRSLERDIIKAIECSPKGKQTREDANLIGESHITSVLTVDEEDDLSADDLHFAATLEIQDDHKHQYETRVRVACERMDDAQPCWRIHSIDMLDIGPLPKSG